MGGSSSEVCIWDLTSIIFKDRRGRFFKWFFLRSYHMLLMERAIIIWWELHCTWWGWCRRKAQQIGRDCGTKDPQTLAVQPSPQREPPGPGTGLWWDDSAPGPAGQPLGKRWRSKWADYNIAVLLHRLESNFCKIWLSLAFVFSNYSLL